MGKDFFVELCSLENLTFAFSKARERKTLKPYVIEFEKNLKQNLLELRSELIVHTCRPKPLQTFILRDPKTRKISKSDFRDRVVHHAICNIIEPIFDKTFIHDSYANRLGKGTLKAVKRFDCFKKKVSRNNNKLCYILKADVKHYFDSVDLDILISIVKRKIKDPRVIHLIQIILSNHSTPHSGGGGGTTIGMPLGNLTSQFLANVYLNELDQFVKHELKVKYYIRYVDDFVILHNSPKILGYYKLKIDGFLKNKLKLELHPDKSKILILNRGVNFLGFRVFYNHKLIRKKNIRKFEKKFLYYKALYKDGLIDREKIIGIFEGWIAYVSHANTYKYRRYLTRLFNSYFPTEQNSEVKNVKKVERINHKIEVSFSQLTTQKTLHLLKKGLSTKQIAEQRQIIEGTVWEHIAKLIEYGQLNVWKMISKEKIFKILSKIQNEKDKLKDIKDRLNDGAITFDEINCVLASIKNQNKKKRN